MTIASNDFTHLHVHSEFSLLDGLGRITDLVDSAAQQGFDSLAITDHGALYGAVAFYQACINKGIKPIIGVETYVARRSMTEKEGKADAQPFHLILLAKDLVGYRNLCRLVTIAHSRTRRWAASTAWPCKSRSTLLTRARPRRTPETVCQITFGTSAAAAIAAGSAAPASCSTRRLDPFPS